MVPGGCQHVAPVCCASQCLPGSKHQGQAVDSSSGTRDSPAPAPPGNPPTFRLQMQCEAALAPPPHVQPARQLLPRHARRQQQRLLRLQAALPPAFRIVLGIARHLRLCRWRPAASSAATGDPATGAAADSGTDACVSGETERAAAAMHASAGGPPAAPAGTNPAAALGLPPPALLPPSPSLGSGSALDASAARRSFLARLL
jgi:hypothetical protein